MEDGYDCALPIPAELDIHRKDLDRARGVPNRGGAATTISLRFDPEHRDRGWLTVCPPSGWDAGWDHFVRDLCHATIPRDQARPRHPRRNGTHHGLGHMDRRQGRHRGRADRARQPRILTATD